MEKPFEIKEICTNLRPAKVAVFVPKSEDWQEKCLNIIENFSQIWGGAKNFIVPTDDEKIDENFWFLLEKFDPDYFFVYYNPEEKIFYDITDELKEEILKKLNPFYESRVGKDPIESSLSPDWPLTFLPDIIPNTDIEEKKIYNPIINYSIAEHLDYIKLMVHSALGKIDDNYIEKISDLDIEIEEKEFNVNFYSLLHDIIWKEENQDYYPFWYSMLKLNLYRKKGDDLRRSPIVLVVGDSLDDFCLYYNLSSLRKDVFWAPFSIIETSFKEIEKLRKSKERSDSELASFNSNLLDELFERVEYRYSDRKIIFTSISESEENLENVKNMLVESMILSYETEVLERILISKNVKELLSYYLSVLEYDNYSNCYMEQFIDSKSINRIKTPIPRNFSHRSFDKHFWITEVNIENYKLPQFTVLNDSIEALRYSNHEIRVSNRGIAYFCPFIGYGGESIDKYLAEPHIRLLEPFEIFERIFDELGYLIITSDKGNYERESTDKFGSLEKIAEFLMKEKYQHLFNKFVEKKNPASPDDGIFLKDDSRMYMGLKAIKRILEDEVDTIINDFIEKEILHRGFIFKCEKCKYTGWYDIEDVDIKFKCRRCRTVQYYESKHLVRQNPVEPEWFYKLDETIYQGYDNDMIVPILTLNELKNQSEESFMYISEIELRKKENPENQYMEIDICCISDGKIIIGECKKSNKLDEENGKSAEEIIDNYIKIYEKLGVSDKELIFSTFNRNGWSKGTSAQKGTLEKIKEALDDKKIDYKLFKGTDLH